MTKKSKRGSGATGRRNRTSLTTAKAIKDAERIALILQWRLQGFTLQQIADNLPEAGFKRVSVVRVHIIIREALAQSIADPVDELRQIEMMRLDVLQTAHFERASQGDFLATDRVLSIMDRRARLGGLNAPVKTDVEARVTANTVAVTAEMTPQQAAEAYAALVKGNG